MKKIFTLSVVMLTAFTQELCAQAGLNNLSFETMTTTAMLACGGNSVQYAAGFRGSSTGTNGATMPNYTLSPVAQQGNKYISIANVNSCGHADLYPSTFSINPNANGLGSPYTSKPTALCGYFRTQGLVNVGDSIYVLVYLTKNGSLIGQGRYTYGANQSNWTNFCATINYTSVQIPDTIRIRFTPSRYLAGVPNPSFTSQSIVMDIDNLYFTGLSGLAERAMDSGIQLYPNPSSGLLNLDRAESIDAELKVYNVTGRLILSRKISSAEAKIDLSAYEDGVYFVQLRSERENTTKRIVIAR